LLSVPNKVLEVLNSTHFQLYPKLCSGGAGGAAGGCVIKKRIGGLEEVSGEMSGRKMRKWLSGGGMMEM
jgi:hypothetical protein